MPTEKHDTVLRSLYVFVFAFFGISANARYQSLCHEQSAFTVTKPSDSGDGVDNRLI